MKYVIVVCMAIAVITLVLFLPIRNVAVASTLPVPDGEDDIKLTKLLPIFQKLKEIRAQQINSHNATILSTFDVESTPLSSSFSDGFSNGFS